MQGCQLTLTAVQHQLLVERKTAIESKFAVSINTPGVDNFCNGNTLNLREISNCSEAVTDNGIYFASINGEQENVIASREYIMEALVHPEIIEFHSYHKELKQIFCSKFWTDLIERIHSVCISNGADCEVNISGSESAVASAVSYLQKLSDIYCTSSHCPNVNTSLSYELSEILKTCGRKDLEITVFSSYPDCVQELLMSWLKEAQQEHFRQGSCTGKLNWNVENFAYPNGAKSQNDSVLILEEAEVSVITIDSNSDEDKNDVMCPKMSRQRKQLKKCKKLNSMSEMQKHTKLVNGATTNIKLKKEEAPKPSSFPNLPDFIPLCASKTKGKSLAQMKSKKQKINGVYGNLVDILPLNRVGASKSLPTAQLVAPLVPERPRKLRPIVIDGSNVAMAHGGGKVFSCEGIALAIEYFVERGHTDITAFVPLSRRHHYFNNISGRELLDKLAEKKQLVFTPSRRVPNGKRITCYDDRFIVDLASRNNGVIVSNDGYLDILAENLDWKKAIQERLLMFCFAGDLIMFPDDPLGEKGPRLKEFLSFPDE